MNFLLHGSNGEHLGQGLPRVQAGTMARKREIQEQVGVCIPGFQRRAMPVPGKGGWQCADEMVGILHCCLLLCQSRGRASCRSEIGNDVGREF